MRLRVKFASFWKQSRYKKLPFFADLRNYLKSVTERAQDLIGDSLPYIKEAIRKYAKSNGGSITVDDLTYDEEEIEQIYFNQLKESVERNLEWIAEIVTEELHEQ